MTVYVSDTLDAFKSNGAKICANNFTVGGNYNYRAHCRRPVTGQYVSIRHNYYAEHKFNVNKYILFELVEVSISAKRKLYHLYKLFEYYKVIGLG